MATHWRGWPGRRPFCRIRPLIGVHDDTRGVTGHSDPPGQASLLAGAVAAKPAGAPLDPTASVGPLDGRAVGNDGGRSSSSPETVGMRIVVRRTATLIAARNHSLIIIAQLMHTRARAPKMRLKRGSRLARRAVE